MTKPSYRMLKWTFFAAMAASLGTACVVSSGDGDDTDIEDGGSSGSSSSASGKGGGGTGGKGGTAGSGGAAGSGGTAGSTADGGEPMGGSPPTYTAGLCQEELGTMTSSDVPSCEPADKDETNACLKCMKASCCEDWQTCYAKDPTTACGWGATSEDDPGQFDCIQQCFTSATDLTDEALVLEECQGICLNQCEGKDQGFIMDITQALVACTRDVCLDECYPAM